MVLGVLDEESPVSTPTAAVHLDPLHRQGRRARRGERRGDRRRERRSERRRLRKLDAASQRLAELHAIQALLGQAIEVLDSGWVQGAWFSVSERGTARTVTAYDLDLLLDRPVSGACLVGAVVHAGGGPAAVRSQLVQRSLDLVWHALREDATQPVRFCPAPEVRARHVRELTGWNDSSGRTRAEIVGLLETARSTADAQRDLCRVSAPGGAA